MISDMTSFLSRCWDNNTALWLFKWTYKRIRNYFYIIFLNENHYHGNLRIVREIIRIITLIIKDDDNINNIDTNCLIPHYFIEEIHDKFWGIDRNKIIQEIKIVFNVCRLNDYRRIHTLRENVYKKL